MDEARSEYSRVNLSSDPIYRYLRITRGGPDGVAGGASEQDLVDAAWMQRLRRIHQLQSAWWVFATAEHSRFQHALGAMHLSGEWARHLYPSLKVSCGDAPSSQLVEETMRMAGLLHDVGHGPFGHFFDENYLDTWGIDHEVIGRALIGGPLADLIGELGASPSTDFEPGERIDPRWVAYLISSRDLDGFEPPPWLAVLRPALVGAFSADNMDYVPRDSYICGVSAGPVDVQRIIHYSFISVRGLTLHSHAAEALYMFLNARLYLYSQVYFHRTVRRIDLQLREVFRPTLELLLGGNPLNRLDRYLGLTEWSLLSDVDRWAHGDGDRHKRELGQAWAAVVARKLKWKLIYQGHTEARDVPTGALMMTREQFARQLREHLPEKLRDIVFEVDVAAQESRAFNPMTETADILFYEPLEGRFQQSRVLDLFRRLPVRMALFRIFARDETHRDELIKAANGVLGLTS
ncbi:MAG TPA: HD domain-containing protein [Candidatus Dormibacteraeota bacterium]|nr:HD domain-containing protein [Candidatus Dormibacteraeota bacterium]